MKGASVSGSCEQGAAGAQGVCAEGARPAIIRPSDLEARGACRLPDEPGDVLVGEPGAGDGASVAADAAKERAVFDAGESDPALDGVHRAGRLAVAATDDDPVFAIGVVQGQRDAFGHDGDGAECVGAGTADVEPDDLGAAQRARETDEQDGAVAQAAQVMRQCAEHREEVIRAEHLPATRGIGPPLAAGLGKRTDDVRIGAIEGMAPPRRIPDEAAEATLNRAAGEGAAVGLTAGAGCEITRDSFRHGRQGGQAVAATPGTIVLPVRGIEPPGVVGKTFCRRLAGVRRAKGSAPFGRGGGCRRSRSPGAPVRPGRGDLNGPAAIERHDPPHLP